MENLLKYFKCFINIIFFCKHPRTNHPTTFKLLIHFFSPHGCICFFISCSAYPVNYILSCPSGLLLHMEGSRGIKPKNQFGQGQKKLQVGERIHFSNTANYRIVCAKHFCVWIKQHNHVQELSRYSSIRSRYNTEAIWSIFTIHDSHKQLYNISQLFVNLYGNAQCHAVTQTLSYNLIAKYRLGSLVCHCFSGQLLIIHIKMKQLPTIELLEWPPSFATSRNYWKLWILLIFLSFETIVPLYDKLSPC